MNTDTGFDYSLEYDQRYQSPQLDRRFPIGVHVLLREFADEEPGTVLGIDREQVFVGWPAGDALHQPDDLMLAPYSYSADDEDAC